MKYILILLLSVNTVFGGSSSGDNCYWNTFDAEYNNALYLNSSKNIICNNFEFINNNITEYCRTHPTNNIMKSLPKIYINRGKYCNWGDLDNIRDINNILFEDYLNPICLMCNNIFNNIHKFNFSDQSYINNSVSICNSISIGETEGNDYTMLILFSIIGTIMVIILILFLYFACKKGEDSHKC
jgi:hypothetical protein